MNSHEQDSWTPSDPTHVVTCWTQPNPVELSGSSQQPDFIESYINDLAETLTDQNGLLADFFDDVDIDSGDVVFVDADNSVAGSSSITAPDDPLSLSLGEPI